MTITATGEGYTTVTQEVTVRQVSCSYCGQTGHTAGACPQMAADEQAALSRLRCLLGGRRQQDRIVGAEPFGPQPFLAIETADGRILHDNLDFGDGPASWRYVFDWQTVSVSEVRRIGIAATSRPA